jgi:isochorismate synthase
MVVRLFAGAGIVEASDPRAEWAETEAKLATMLRAFGVEREIAP